MKKFFLHIIEGVAALVVFFIVIPLCFVIVMAIASIGSSSSKPVEEGSILRVSLSTTLSERQQEDNPFNSIMSAGKEDNMSGLDVLLTAIAEAKSNDKIEGIYLDGGALISDFALLQELRAALLDFKKSGKFIMSYAEQFTQAGYYIASTADTIMINPEGMLDWHGISSTLMFYTDLLKKLGVKFQVFKVGTFKSAVEPFILTEMSDANRMQVNAFIGDIWDSMVNDIAAARPQLDADSLRAYAANYMALAKAETYKRLAMVDTLVYADGAREWLRQHSKKQEVRLASASDVAALHEKTDVSDQHIAVYYAVGDIVDAQGTGALIGSTEEIVGSTVVEDLDKLANDKNVKAVVLRINSGGGSAYASEQMWRAIQLLKQQKPVVVSMSGMAASGGYYMSCGADYIVADETTLTGSIGIFGLIPDPSELLNDKLELHFDVARTNPGADFGAMGRPLNAAECAAMQQYVESGYDLFTRRVAEGRGMSQAQVDSIGQGRVWTGHQALSINLVDELGTLEVAVAKAKELALAKAKDDAQKSGKEFKDSMLDIKGTVAYPTSASFIEQMMAKANTDDYMERKTKALMGDYYEPMRIATALTRQSHLQARIPFAPNIR